MVSASEMRQALVRLAHAYGIQASYRDVDRQRRIASEEALLAVLRALGAPLSALREAPVAYQAQVRERWGRLMAPSSVAWEGVSPPAPLLLPEGTSPRTVRCTLTLESGETQSWTLPRGSMRGQAPCPVDDTVYESAVLPLPEPLTPGYHTLAVEVGERLSRRLVISAPRRAFTPSKERRAWGVFLPLYALHSQESAGAGDLGDLEALAKWTGALGGSLVGVLPFLAAFLDQPFDPSPYAPASRLFWNELFLDIKRLPELGRCPQARAMLESDAFLREAEALRCAPLVDYRRQMALKRRVLEMLPECLGSEPTPRREALEAYAKANPEAECYARFRATLEGQGKPWQRWPEPQRGGRLGEGDYQAEARRYHLYVQWAMEQQMEALAEEGRQAGGAGLYLDLPLGVHPQGYDAWRWQNLFVPEVSLGAPPDALGPEGQEWGIPPLHPQGLQGEGMAYFVACLRHHMRHAQALRLDHVMGLHRLFWVPRGMKASQGVYVRYPAEELYAALTLESQRHQTMVIGEDLGTVPPYVRPAMARHGLHRMYVVQFEMARDPARALRPVPTGAIASVNTHDTPTFAGFCQGQDLEQRRRSGALAGPQAEQEQQGRKALVASVAQHLLGEGLLHGEVANPQELLKGVLGYLGRSPAALALVSLEDLWGETRPQNVPGTGEEHPNWRRKATYSLEELARLPQVLRVTAALADARRRAQEATGQAAEEGEVRSVFSLRAPEARSVALVGDFNGWDARATQMRRAADGLWRTAVRLAPGVHQYKFLVDGSQWLEDPSNPLRLPNPFGSYNSVREVVPPHG